MARGRSEKLTVSCVGEVDPEYRRQAFRMIMGLDPTDPVQRSLMAAHKAATNRPTPLAPAVAR